MNREESLELLTTRVFNSLDNGTIDTEIIQISVAGMSFSYPVVAEAFEVVKDCINYLLDLDGAEIAHNTTQCRCGSYVDSGTDAIYLTRAHTYHVDLVDNACLPQSIVTYTDRTTNSTAIVGWINGKPNKSDEFQDELDELIVRFELAENSAKKSAQ